MKFALLTGDESPEDICETIANLRATQRKRVIASTAREYAEDIDELIDMLPRHDGPDAA